MVDLSLHLLDIVQNSLEAGAGTVTVEVSDKPEDRLITVGIADDGRGMDSLMLAKVTDPFVTTRKTRRVGLGIPLLKQVAEMSGGGLSLESEVGRGTKLVAWFERESFDRPPMGDIAGTLAIAIGTNPNVRFILDYQGKTQFRFDTLEISELLGGIPLSEPSVVQWIRQYLKERIRVACGGEPV